MVTIYLHDTGYIKPGEETGTAYTAVDAIANGGTPLPLKGATISYSRGLSFDNKPQPGLFQESRLNYVSLTNPVISISGHITGGGDMSNVRNAIYKITSGNTDSITDQDGNTSNNEIDILYVLDLMVTTKGYKELYYKDSTANGSILYGLGKTDVFNPTYRHLHVMCKGVTISQDGSSGLIKWTLSCEVTR